MAGIRTSFVALLLSTFLLNSFNGSSQELKKIKFGKNSGKLYFFQKGTKSDTVVKEKSDLFYLLVPDSMKPYLSLSVENGRLVRASNDSLVRLEAMPGLRYESVFLAPALNTAAPTLNSGDQKTNSQPEFKTRINGASDKQKEVILIRLIDKKHDKLLLENVFYYQD